MSKRGPFPSERNAPVHLRGQGVWGALTGRSLQSQPVVMSLGSGRHILTVPRFSSSRPSKQVRDPNKAGAPDERG